MIRAVAIAVLAICASGLITGLALTIRQFVRHPGQRHQPRAWADAAVTLPAAEQAIPRRDVAGAPPWNPAAGWAGDCAPDPETWQLHHQAAIDHQGGRAWPASGNGNVTVAEPLEPLPPEPKPGPHPAPATTARTAPTAADRTSDALTLLDERQQLIDHAAAVIAAAKFDRILGMAVAP